MNKKTKRVMCAKTFIKAYVNIKDWDLQIEYLKFSEFTLKVLSRMCTYLVFCRFVFSWEWVELKFPKMCQFYFT